jgi:hypothetical protein
MRRDHDEVNAPVIDNNKSQFHVYQWGITHPSPLVTIVRMKREAIIG